MGSWTRSALKGIKTAKQIQRIKDQNEKARQSELKRQKQIQIQREYEREQSLNKLKRFNGYIDQLISLHMESVDVIDWYYFAFSDPPVRPIRKNIYEQAAKTAAKSYRPTIFDRLFLRSDKKRRKLEKEINISKQLDEKEYQKKLKKFQIENAEWKLNNPKAQRVLNKDKEVCLQVLIDANLCKKLDNFISNLQFYHIDSQLLEVSADLNGYSCVPTIQKKLKSGRLSESNMTKRTYHMLRRDFTCSCTLRLAKEIYALVPYDNVLIHARDKIADKSGNFQTETVLSIKIQKQALMGLKLNTHKPSKLIKSFPHNIKFSRMRGLKPVSPINCQQVLQSNH